MDLREKAFELARHLNFEGIIEIEDLDGLENQSYEDIVLLLRQKLQETYPQTRLKRTMKSVHFAIMVLLMNGCGGLHSFSLMKSINI